MKGERRLGKIRGGKPINEIEHFVINYINYEQERKRSRWVKLNYDVFDVSGIIYIVQSCPDVIRKCLHTKREENWPTI